MQVHNVYQVQGTALSAYMQSDPKGAGLPACKPEEVVTMTQLTVRGGRGIAEDKISGANNECPPE